MDNRTKQRMRNAFLANAPVPKEIASGAQKSVIVERLHNGNSRRLASVIGGRGDKWKGVMEMGDVRQFPSENVAQSSIRALRPGSAPSEACFLQKGVPPNLRVVPPIFDDLVAGFAQKPDFRLADGVLATRLLIEVVRHKNFHGLALSKVLAARLFFFTSGVRSRQRNVACVVSSRA